MFENQDTFLNDVQVDNDHEVDCGCLHDDSAQSYNEQERVMQPAIF